MLPHGPGSGRRPCPRATSATRWTPAAKTVSSSPSRPNIASRRTAPPRSSPVPTATEPPAGRATAARLRDPAPGGQLDQVGEQREEVHDPRRGDGLVAQRLPCGVGHVAPLALVPAVRPPARRAPRSTSSPPARSSTATSTSVPSPSRRARTQARRGRMNSDPSSPSSASTTPLSAIHLPGVWLIWILFHRSSRSNSRCRRRRELDRVAQREVDAEHRPVRLLTSSTPPLSRA